MKILKELFNDPLNFFDKRRNFREGFLWMLFSIFIFVLLTQLMIYVGFVQFELNVSPLRAIIVNYVTLVGGYFIVAAVCFLPFRFVGGKRVKDIFTITAYSLMPMLFLWIPHILPQAIMTVLTMTLITKGVTKYAKVSSRKALTVTVPFVILTIVFSLVVRNFILPYVGFYI